MYISNGRLLFNFKFLSIYLLFCFLISSCYLSATTHILNVIFNYSTNINKKPETKKSQANFFANLTKFLERSIIYNLHTSKTQHQICRSFNIFLAVVLNTFVVATFPIRLVNLIACHIVFWCWNL